MIKFFRKIRQNLLSEGKINNGTFPSWEGQRGGYNDEKDNPIQP